MDPEDIVRALAAADEPLAPYTHKGIEGFGSDCVFCGGEPAASEPHEPDCPWLLAREWVEVKDGTL